MKKNLIITIVVALLVGALAFYGGLTYGSKKNSALRLPGNFDRANMNGQGLANRQPSDAFANGEVLSKDEQSITIKLRDGGSKIVLLSASSTVARMAEGSMADVMVGSSVMVTGTSNSDGSLSAKSIQLSPGIQVPATAPKQ